MDHYLFGKENSFDFVAFLKGSDQLRELPVFVVSNTASPEKVRSYLQLGQSIFIPKPTTVLTTSLGILMRA